MDFLVAVMLSMSILVSCSSARSTFDSQEGEETKAAVEDVTTFELTVKDGEQYYKGEIIINKDKQTETMHFDAHGQSEEADIVFDFKRNAVMYRVPARQLCFLGPIDEDTPQPNELAEELEREKSNPENVHAARPTTKWNAKSLLEARFLLSDEMAKLCVQEQIYLLERDVTQVNVAKEIGLPSGRVKRYPYASAVFIASPGISVTISISISFGKRRR